jgi:aspartyl-tRNA(Asn)/glutamyl-tRNA(Gln) amidotransferase subunit A
MMPSAADITRQIRAGERSAAEILADTETRIRKLDPGLNCFTDLTFARARKEAAAIDALRASGQPLPPLAGVPYAVKNLFDIEGVVTLCGGKINETLPAAASDAELVARMRAAGAILVGALNMDEHAYGFTTENTHFGATRNPHDRAHISGGSSGGSAAAIAGGLVPITLGSDTNGSIRVPSSLCGTFGLKPTYGRLPRTGSFPFVHSLDHLGPFAANVADLAAAYDAMQGPDPRDPACAQRPVETTAGVIGTMPELRVAILGGWFHDWAGPAARRAVQRAAETLGTDATVELRGAQAARAAAFVITGAEAGALHRERLIARYADYEPLSRDRLVAGSLIPAAWSWQAQRVRREVHREALALFDRYDLLIAPATPVSAPPIGTETITLNGRELPARPNMGLLTQPLSCIGLPVCAAPVWPDATGDPQDAVLPIGVQLIAAPWREDLCLAAARILEAAGVAEFRCPVPA